MDTMYILFLFVFSAAFSIYPDVKTYIDLNKLLMFLTYGFIEEKEEEKKIENNIPDKPPVSYDKKYLDRFRDMKEHDKIDKEALTSSMVIDYTPYGNVAMKYDEKRGIFMYYSDHSIPYRFLESVAQKFAIQFDCKSLVVDTEKELEKMTKSTKDNEIAIDNKETSEPIPQPEKKDVFAKFKTYNKSSVPGGSNTVSTQAGSSTSNSKPDLELEKSNTYSCEGKFSNMELLQSVKKNAFDSRLKMSYAQFKQMCLT